MRKKCFPYCATKIQTLKAKDEQRTMYDDMSKREYRGKTAAPIWLENTIYTVIENDQQEAEQELQKDEKSLDDLAEETQQSEFSKLFADFWNTLKTKNIEGKTVTFGKESNNYQITGDNLQQLFETTATRYLMENNLLPPQKCSIY